MRAGSYSFTCEQGTTFIRDIMIEQPDLATDPTGQTFEPFSLVGYDARMQVRRTTESTAFLVELTSDNGGLIINPDGEDTNVIRIYMDDAVTSSISNSGVYDLEVISGTGVVSRILQGTFTLSPQVTR